jgi:malate dehydrogenase
MSAVAILGAGPIGASVAHTLAQRERFRSIRLIDESANVAAGKALDIRQSGPVDGWDTELAASGDVLDAAGASVIVIADPVGGGPYDGERGLGLVRQLMRAGATAPFVFAAPGQRTLIEMSYRELKVDASRMIGTAAAGLQSAARALVALEVGLAGADTSVPVVGRPPGVVVGWSSATIGSSLVTDRVPAHRLAAIAQGLRKLWPSGAYTIGTVTAPVVEALVFGGRRLHSGVVVIETEPAARGAAALVPLELGGGRVQRIVMPSLSPQERTEFLNALTTR